MPSGPSGNPPRKGGFLKFCLMGCAGLILLTILPVAGLVALYSQSSTRQAGPPAETAIRRFQAGDYKTIFAALDPESDWADDYDQLAREFNHVTEVMGPLNSWKKTEVSSSSTEEVTLVTLQYKAVFANGDGYIQVIVRAEYGEPPFQVMELRVFSEQLD